MPFASGVAYIFKVWYTFWDSDTLGKQMAVPVTTNVTKFTAN